jgi:hypothetical protein
MDAIPPSLLYDDAPSGMVVEGQSVAEEFQRESQVSFEHVWVLIVGAQIVRVDQSKEWLTPTGFYIRNVKRGETGHTGLVCENVNLLFSFRVPYRRGLLLRGVCNKWTSGDG